MISLLMDNAAFFFFFILISLSNIQRHYSEMIMMTVKAMINFLFYQIWHFAASGSFYYQFHSQMSRDLLFFSIFSQYYFAYSLMFFNIKYTLLISILSVFIEIYTTCRVYSLSIFIFGLICYCCFYLFTWPIHLCIYIYDLVLLILFKFIMIISLNEFQKTVYIYIYIY